MDGLCTQEQEGVLTWGTHGSQQHAPTCGTLETKRVAVKRITALMSDLTAARRVRLQ